MLTKLKPNTPGQRGTVLVSKKHLWKGDPYKTLTKPQPSSGGRSEKKAAYYCNKIKPYFDTIKYHSDKLELLIDDELWPLPKLRELLFTR